ncbi:Villin headpiece domain-containing protein, partial [Prochlorococcus sp. AH-736-A21]|nr:Villin headpiece domain-containing protein [Prochlorococcus sp. AH-736-A21]
MNFKIFKIFAIPLFFSSFLFDTSIEFNKVNANIKNSPANKNDLDLYHGMGVSFLCNATRKGF